ERRIPSTVVPRTQLRPESLASCSRRSAMRSATSLLVPCGTWASPTESVTWTVMPSALKSRSTMRRQAAPVEDPRERIGLGRALRLVHERLREATLPHEVVIGERRQEHDEQRGGDHVACERDLEARVRREQPREEHVLDERREDRDE